MSPTQHRVPDRSHKSHAVALADPIPEIRLSSTLKMMQVMLEKGLLLRNDKVRPQLYRPSKKQATTQIGLLDSVALKAFGGSAKNMVASLVSNKRLSGKEIAELKELLAETGNTNKKER